jgi:Dyp-type peroxidase family
MITARPALEAPAPGPLQPAPDVDAGRQKEPVLAADQIQGNIFPGFNKDAQTLLFLRVRRPAAFAAWLRDFIPTVATAERVLPMRRVLKNIRSATRAEATGIDLVWTNIAFTFAGLKKLESPALKLDDFKDAAFKAGLLARSTTADGDLGDPVGSGQLGDPAGWVVGGKDSEPDVVLILGGDTRDHLNREVSELVATLFPRTDAGGQLVGSGAEIIFRQDGDTLKPPLTGHEHFGFRDGISQPGVRGRLPDGSFLTPSQNPLDDGQGKPGQDLLWPGEFVFGYPGQDGAKDVSEPGTDPLKSKTRGAPEFARNGSMLVFRRLRQNVGRFHRFLQSMAAQFQVDEDLVGARMVGRWTSGAPAVVTPAQDDIALAQNDCRNNNFEYDTPDDTPTTRPPVPGDCTGVTPPPNDPTGAKVPFDGHIRKAYPRNDRNPAIPEIGESTTQTHRLLRRGIPFGEQSSSTAHRPVDDDAERGLLFLAYQVSIVEQFEFVTQAWVNNIDFKQTGAGFDPVIGQNSQDADRKRTFNLSLPGQTQPITTTQEWVFATGGGYFFAPSIDALKQLAAFGTNGQAGRARTTAARAKGKAKPPKRKPGRGRR